MDFVVSAGEGGHERELWARRLDPRARVDDAFWVTGDVDLGAFAGRPVTVVLETRGDGEVPPAEGAVWGAPAITGPRGGRLIVLYLVDTLRADHTGPYGYARKTTPHLDEFARDSALFEQAIASSSWTKPSVASVMTALPPSRHGAMLRSDGLGADHVTLAEQLRAGGWSTGAVVANPVVYDAYGGFDQGFDCFAGLQGRRHRPTRGIRAGAVVEAALSWIDSRRGLPSFVYVHTMDPHFPYDPPKPFDRMFAGPPGAAAARGAGDASEWDLRETAAAYDGEIAYGDQEFGRFVRELKNRGLYDRATIVFLSDHGEEFLDHGGWRHGSSLFDELVRVPLLVKFADRRGAGGRFGAQVQLLDLARTVLGEAGLEAPATFGGRSLRGVVEGEARADDTALLELTHRGTVAVGSRTATEKLVRRYRPQDDILRFDLVHDPGERAPLPLPGPERRRVLDALVQATLRPNLFRHVLWIQAVGRFDLALETTGTFEQVESAGLGAAEGTAAEDEGRTLRLRLQPRPGRPREVSFRVRPRGAPIRLTGTWNERNLGARDVAGAVSQGADSFLLPDPEAELEPAIAARFFARPDVFRAAITVWLDRTGAPETPEVDAEELEALRALGYVGK